MGAKLSLSFPRRREPITQWHLRHRMDSRLRGNDTDTFVICVDGLTFVSALINQPYE